jgi:hypothetical protein
MTTAPQDDGLGPADPAGPQRRSVGRTAATAAAVALGTAALGLPYALIWALVAPDIPLVKVDGVDLLPEIGPNVVPTQPEPEQFVAGDGWFAVLGAVFGVVAAAGAWRFARRARGPVALVALTVGAVGAGMLAAWLGQRIGLDDYRQALAAAPTGARLSHPPRLSVDDLPLPFGVPLVAGLAAAVTYTLLASWSRHPSLRPGRETPGAHPADMHPGEAWPGLSSGSSAPSDR